MPLQPRPTRGMHFREQQAMCQFEKTAGTSICELPAKKCIGLNPYSKPLILAIRHVSGKMVQQGQSALVCDETCSDTKFCGRICKICHPRMIDHDREKHAAGPKPLSLIIGVDELNLRKKTAARYSLIFSLDLKTRYMHNDTLLGL